MMRHFLILKLMLMERLLMTLGLSGAVAGNVMFRVTLLVMKLSREGIR